MSPSAVAEETDVASDVPPTKAHNDRGSPAAPPSPPSSTGVHEEYQYLNLIRDILDHGEHRPDRYVTRSPAIRRLADTDIHRSTGTGTYSIFAPPQLRFSLSRPSSSSSVPPLILPLLTTKRVFLRAVIAELLWFISGSTSSLPLSAQGVRIWDGNGSRAFLDAAGLTHREEGDLGPVYGFQWRHFGAAYVDARHDYAGEGVDQLAEVLRKLRYAPYDRRIILCAWNPADLSKMALPPCHMFAQFYVSFPSSARRGGVAVGAAAGAADSAGELAPRKGVLHAVLYQRSCDMGLGVPFNIASYALLTHMLAHAADLTPGTLTHTMGDAHVYLDHVDALRTQLEREPREFPTLSIARPRGVQGGQGVAALEGWTVEDFVVKGYKPHGAVAMKMSV